MTLAEIAEIAGNVLMIGGAIAMIVFVVISVYILMLVRKVHGVFETIKGGYETIQQRVQIPMMLLTAFLAKQGLDSDDQQKKK